MLHLFKNGLSASLITISAINANAKISYTDMLKSITTTKSHVVMEIPKKSELTNAKSLEDAMKLISGISYAQALELSATVNTTEKLPDTKDIMNLVNKKKVTFVIVPGLLGEFIETRAFEEIFAKNSKFKAQWESIVKSKKLKGSHYSIKANAQVEADLATLINAASVEDQSGNELFRIVILKTETGSLESIGDNVQVAALFNQRLEMYYNAMKEEGEEQNLVMVGYSRGTPLSLEMLAQANRSKSKFNYVQGVKAMTSYAGVVMGSSLADVTDDLNTPNGQMKQAAQEYMNALRYSSSPSDILSAFQDNNMARIKFAGALLANGDLNADGMQDQVKSGDFKTVIQTVAGITKDVFNDIQSFIIQSNPTTILNLDMNKVNTDYNSVVERKKIAIKAAITSVDGLKSQSRVDWWSDSKNVLPKSIKYYSLAAVMADPAKGGIEKAVFEMKNVGYNGMIDDDQLLLNRRTYEEVSNVALNDSQVALPQSVFLPKTISTLNPANSGLQTEMLAVLETHHWGASLKVVNKMKNGVENKYPREEILLALAAYVNQEVK